MSILSVNLFLVTAYTFLPIRSPLIDSRGDDNVADTDSFVNATFEGSRLREMRCVQNGAGRQRLQPSTAGTESTMATKIPRFTIHDVTRATKVCCPVQPKINFADWLVPGWCILGHGCQAVTLMRHCFLELHIRQTSCCGDPENANSVRYEA